MAIIDTTHMVTNLPRKIRDINGTFNLSIPAQYLRSANLHIGDYVEFLFNDQYLVVYPVGKPPGSIRSKAPKR
jgi:hypothetical protein